MTKPCLHRHAQPQGVGTTHQAEFQTGLGWFSCYRYTPRMPILLQPLPSHLFSVGGGDGSTANQGKLDKQPWLEATVNMSIWLNFFKTSGPCTCGPPRWRVRPWGMSCTLQCPLTLESWLMTRVGSTQSGQRLKWWRGSNPSLWVLHTYVHTVTLHEAEQLPEKTENVCYQSERKWSQLWARVRVCLWCHWTILNTVYHVVLEGLWDRDLQSRCISQAL